MLIPWPIQPLSGNLCFQTLESVVIKKGTFPPAVAFGKRFLLRLSCILFIPEPPLFHVVSLRKSLYGEPRRSWRLLCPTLLCHHGCQQPQPRCHHRSWLIRPSSCIELTYWLLPWSPIQFRGPGCKPGQISEAVAFQGHMYPVSDLLRRSTPSRRIPRTAGAQRLNRRGCTYNIPHKITYVQINIIFSAKTAFLARLRTFYLIVGKRILYFFDPFRFFPCNQPINL